MTFLYLSACSGNWLKLVLEAAEESVDSRPECSSNRTEPGDKKDRSRGMEMAESSVLLARKHYYWALETARCTAVNIELEIH